MLTTKANEMPRFKRVPMIVRPLTCSIIAIISGMDSEHINMQLNKEKCNVMPYYIALLTQSRKFVLHSNFCTT